MAEPTAFDKRIDGLAAHYRALTEVDPQHPDHSPVADPSLYDGLIMTGWIHSFVRQASSFPLRAMAGLARNEYKTVRGLETRDLREDTPEQLAERGNLLAVMTCPVEPGVRETRAARITAFLGRALDGEVIETTGYEDRGHTVEPQRAQLDTARAIFATLGAVDKSGSFVFFNYDNPETDIGPDRPNVAFLLHLNAAFREHEPVLLTPAA